MYPADWYEGGLVQQRMQHAFNHGLFAPSLKAQIDAACDPDWINRSDACQTLLGKMADQVRSSREKKKLRVVILVIATPRVNL